MKVTGEWNRWDYSDSIAALLAILYFINASEDNVIRIKNLFWGLFIVLKGVKFEVSIVCHSCNKH